jgi:hypothetical protein
MSKRRWVFKMFSGDCAKICRTKIWKHQTLLALKILKIKLWGHLIVSDSKRSNFEKTKKTLRGLTFEKEKAER